MVVPLKPDTGVDSAIQQLTSIQFEFGNARGGVGRTANDVRDAYLALVERTEPLLKNYFSDPAVWGRLYGRRYWAIRDVRPDTPRWGALIGDEAAEQASYIERLVLGLKQFSRWISAAPGRMAVIDTNVLLHYQPPTQIPWCKVLSEEAVRLVVPLRVVEELDEKKYLARDDLAARARGILSGLWHLVGPCVGMPTELDEQTGVTIEVPVDSDPRERTLDADEEVLNLCSVLKSVPAGVLLVTGDTGMSLRAANRQIPVKQLPENYLRRNVQIAVGEVAF